MAITKVSFELKYLTNVIYIFIKSIGKYYDDPEHWPVKYYDDSENIITFETVYAGIDDVCGFVKLLYNYLLKGKQLIEKENRQDLSSLFEEISFSLEGTIRYEGVRNIYPFKVEMDNGNVSIKDFDDPTGTESSNNDQNNDASAEDLFARNKLFADSNYIPSLINLGHYYANGFGSERNLSLAADFMDKAVAAGASNAEEAAKLYRDASERLVLAKKGDPEAQAYMATFYMGLSNEMTENGGEDNYKESVFWAEKAVAKNNTDAMYTLALAYEHGRGVEQGKEKAVSLYEKAAELGHAPSQHNLGCCYLKGDGVSVDKKKAFGLFNKSAAQNYGLAMRALGVCYQFGHGVQEDMKEAIKWYEKSLDISYDPELAAKVEIYKTTLDDDTEMTQTRSFDDVLDFINPSNSGEHKIKEKEKIDAADMVLDQMKNRANEIKELCTQYNKNWLEIIDLYKSMIFSKKYMSANEASNDMAKIIKTQQQYGRKFDELIERIDKDGQKAIADGGDYRSIKIINEMIDEAIQTTDCLKINFGTNGAKVSNIGTSKYSVSADSMNIKDKWEKKYQDISKDKEYHKTKKAENTVLNVKKASQLDSKAESEKRIKDMIKTIFSEGAVLSLPGWRKKYNELQKINETAFMRIVEEMFNAGEIDKVIIGETTYYGTKEAVFKHNEDMKAKKNMEASIQSLMEKEKMIQNNVKIKNQHIDDLKLSINRIDNNPFAFFLKAEKEQLSKELKASENELTDLQTQQENITEQEKSLKEELENKYGTLIEEEKMRLIEEKEIALRKYSRTVYGYDDRHLANAILSVLKLDQGMRITDMQETSFDLQFERNQDISKMLRKLMEAGLVNKTLEKSMAFFTLKYELTSEERLHGYVAES